MIRHVGVILLLWLTIHVHVEALVSYQPEGSEGVEFDSNNFPDTVFEGPICSPMYLLKLKAECKPDLRANFTLPESVIVDADTFGQFCLHYGDVIENLPDQSPSKPTLVVFPSPYTSGVGTLSDPFGNLTRAQALAASGYYGLVVVSRSAGMILTENRAFNICVTSDMGPFPTFYASPGWIAYQVIMSIFYALILLFAVAGLVRFFMGKFYLFRFLLFSIAGIMGLFKFLEFTIDYENHLGRMNVVGWGFLTGTCSLLSFVCCSIMVNGWAQFASRLLTNKVAKIILKLLRLNGYVIVPLVLIELISILLHWGFPSVFPAVVPALFTGLLLIVALLFGISFIIMGTKVLLLMGNAMGSDHKLVRWMTAIAMASVGIIFINIIFLFCQFYFEVATVEAPFSTNLGLFVANDILDAIMGVFVLASLHMLSQRDQSI